MYVSAALAAMLVGEDQLGVIQSLLRVWYYNDSKSVVACMEASGAADCRPKEVIAHELLLDSPSLRAALVDMLRLSDWDSVRTVAAGSADRVPRKELDAKLDSFAEQIREEQPMRAHVDGLMAFARERVYHRFLKHAGSLVLPHVGGMECTSFSRDLAPGVRIVGDALLSPLVCGIVVSDQTSTELAWAHVVMWATDRTRAVLCNTENGRITQVKFNDEAWERIMRRLKRRLCLSLPLLQSVPRLLTEMADCATSTAAEELVVRWSL